MGRRDQPTSGMMPSGLAFFGAAGLLFSMLGGLAFFLGRQTVPKPAPIVVRSTSPTITQLQAMGELVVLKVSVSDVLEGAGAGYKGVWLVKGDALVAVDLRKARFKSVDEEHKSLVITLPRPRVIQPRVDHDKTKTWNVKKEVWFGGDPDALRDATMREAQLLVNHACTNRAVLEQAEYNTSLLLVNMYRFVDWQVDIDWEDDSRKSSGSSSDVSVNRKQQ
jgi:hypothetical protein